MKVRTRPTAIAAAVLALVATSAFSSAQASSNHSNDKHKPSHDKSRVAAGTLLTRQALHADASLPSAGKNYGITYMSEDGDGDPIVVSGAIALPAGKAPKGGWPVLSWGHGTTGYADVCAPSAQGTEGLAPDAYLDVMKNFVDHWVAKGYAVARTDYEGLGTPGGHTYMNAVSASNTLTDIVRAARQIDKNVSKTWVTAGHSQGGQAVLAAAQMAPKRAPELNLVGAVSIAPGGVGLAQTPAWARNAPPGSEAIQHYIPLIVLGAAAADSSIDPSKILSQDASKLVDFTRSGCPGQLPAPATIPMDKLFVPDADLTRLESYLNAQDPLNLKPRVPVLLQAGTADTQVALAGVKAMKQAYCANGTSVTFREYAGLDHRPMLVNPAPRIDADAWIDRVVKGGKPQNDCV